jgi:hypothetical protein
LSEGHERDSMKRRLNILIGLGCITVLLAAVFFHRHVSSLAVWERPPEGFPSDIVEAWIIGEKCYRGDCSTQEHSAACPRASVDPELLDGMRNAAFSHNIPKWKAPVRIEIVRRDGSRHFGALRWAGPTFSVPSLFHGSFNMPISIPKYTRTITSGLEVLQNAQEASDSGN